jgi:hypothetical protein
LGVLAGAGLVLIGSLIWLSFRETPGPPASEIGEAVGPVPTEAGPGAPESPRVVGAAPLADPTSELKRQLEGVISGIRDANQKKDLSQLLSHYSSNSPQLTQRAQNISKSWKVYDYPKMEFEMDDIKLLAANAATARVTWEVEARNISTAKSKHLSETYLIRFIKESDHWRVQTLEKID